MHLLVSEMIHAPAMKASTTSSSAQSAGFRADPERVMLPRPPATTAAANHQSKRRQRRKPKLAVHEHGAGGVAKPMPACSAQARATSSRRRQNDRGRPSAEVSLSKAMSWALRHGAAKLQLPLRPDGFVPVTALLRALERDNGRKGRRAPTDAHPTRQAAPGQCPKLGRAVRWVEVQAQACL